MLRRTLPPLVLAALLVPAAALAKKVEVNGPATIHGRGPVHGGLHAEARATVDFRFRAAQIRVVGKADDLQVTCDGARAKKREATNRRGLKVVLCKGRAMIVAVTATRFRFAARSRGAYGIQIPEGVSGVLYGHFRRATTPPAEDQRADEGS